MMMVHKNSGSLVTPEVFYPDSDGKPMGETPLHVLNFRWLVELLDAWFAQAKRVFVAGNMFVYYEQGRPRRHVSPDVFVVRGIPKIVDPQRRRYLLWENKAIDFVIELTSDSTRTEDTDHKMSIYRDIIGVKEYFLFDPYEEHLHPPLQGYRLSRGVYVPIRQVDGRLPSKVTGLHLEAAGELLRLYDPATQAWLLTPPEEREARLEAEQVIARAEDENERLRREIAALRRQLDEQQ
jgi:Uma2 family endonuclease